MNTAVKNSRENRLNPLPRLGFSRRSFRAGLRPISLPKIFTILARSFRAGSEAPLPAILLGMLMLPQLMMAGSLYWDINGAAAGAGGATPSGTWDTSLNYWNPSSAGTSPTTVWTDGNAAVFSAGSDATGSYTITLSGTQSPSGVVFQSGTATLFGGTLSLGGGAITVNATATKGRHWFDNFRFRRIDQIEFGRTGIDSRQCFFRQFNQPAGHADIEQQFGGRFRFDCI